MCFTFVLYTTIWIYSIVRSEKIKCFLSPLCYSFMYRPKFTILKCQNDHLQTASFWASLFLFFVLFGFFFFLENEFFSAWAQFIHIHCHKVFILSSLAFVFCWMCVKLFYEVSSLVFINAEDLEGTRPSMLIRRDILIMWYLGESFLAFLLQQSSYTRQREDGHYLFLKRVQQPVTFSPSI